MGLALDGHALDTGIEKRWRAAALKACSGVAGVKDIRALI
jgi:hypothetical protein